MGPKGEQKQRKVMDGAALRTKGTEFADAKKTAELQESRNNKNRRPAAKKDWRAQHEAFIEAIRSARN